MASVYLHSGIISSPKHAPLSDGAFRLWTHALCWSKEHLTDGYIPTGMLPSLHARADKFVPELLRVLVPGKSPLWAKDGDGYRIHDFGDWQDTAAVVQTRRQKWRASKQKDSKVDSKVESTLESKGDSNRDSRQGLVNVNVNVNEKVNETHTPTVCAPASGVPNDDYLSDPGEMPTMKRSSGHAWTSRRGVSVPHFLHDELLKRLGSAGTDAALREWYADTEAAWPAGPIGDDAPTFWRARFREVHGTTVAPLRPKSNIAGWADGLVAGGKR